MSSFTSRVLAAVVLAALPSCGAVAPQGDAPPSTAAPSSPVNHAGGADVLAVAIGSELRFIGVDGSSTTVAAGDPIFRGATGVDLIGASTFVLVRAYADHSPAPGALTYTVVGSDGSVQWTQRFGVSFAGGSSDSRGALVWSPQLSADDASVVVADPASGLRMLAGGGTSEELPGYGPLGAAVGGYLPVATTWNAATPSKRTYAWWKVGPGRELTGVRTLTVDDQQRTSPVSIGYRIVRLERRDTGSVLLVDTRGETVTIALPRATAEASIVSPSNDEMFGEDHWLLVASGVPDRLVRVDVASGAAQAVEVVPPPGYRPFVECEASGTHAADLRIDRDGRLYGLFRNDDRVAAFSTLDGSTWSQLGGSFTGVGGLALSSVRGTYMLRGHDEVYCFGSGPTWSPKSGADFVGTLTQIVRPSAGTQLVLPTAVGDRRTFAEYTLSRTGRFGAGWVVKDGVATLKVVDLETGARTDVATDTTGIRSAQPVWLWRP